MNDPDVKYTHFDFHQECGQSRWHNIRDKLMREFRGDLQAIGWYDSTEKMTQQGIVRTNCIDCLDRTNVVQSELARAVLEQWLQKTGMLAAGATIKDAMPQLNAQYMNMWADHADAISIMYSGTPALKTDFTRTGKRTLQG